MWTKSVRKEHFRMRKELASLRFLSSTLGAPLFHGDNDEQLLIGDTVACHYVLEQYKWTAEGSPRAILS